MDLEWNVKEVNRKVQEELQADVAANPWRKTTEKLKSNLLELW